MSYYITPWCGKSRDSVSSITRFGVHLLKQEGGYFFVTSKKGITIQQGGAYLLAKLMKGISTQ